MAYVGIDLAWNDRARTGLAVLDADGALTASGSVGSDAEIDDWLARHVAHGREIIAVDAPLVVTNETGQRDCERLVTSVYGRYDAGCHSSNRSMSYMNPPRAERLAQRHGWEVDPGSTARPLCLEVYPHAAMVGLFELGRTLKYKKGSIETRRPALAEVVDRIEGLDNLKLRESRRWQEIVEIVTAASRPADINRVEDEVDAILCAHLAWLWDIDAAALHVYGSAAAGYIVAPPPPTHAPAPRPRTTRPPATHAAAVMPGGNKEPISEESIGFTVDGTPVSFATSGEAAWRAAVGQAARPARDGRSPILGRTDLLPPA
ncbi:DUF429 domain-containing protein [Georgenia sp. Z1491]|uniref:DUF429 domain-containing protein n=1 Tax=Georgenia sp. Z1491 TaxID=3416707 RepID=UPI003CF8EAB8